VKIEKLLVTTDLSEAAEHALPLAASMAERFGAEVTLLTILDYDADLPPGVLALSAEREQALKQEVRQKVKAQLEALRARHFGGDVRVQLAIEEGGGAAQVIGDYAREHGIDLLVISTHGRGGLPRLLLGSVAERVVRSAPCPVLTLHPPAEGDA